MFESNKRQVSMAQRAVRQTASAVTETARLERERRALDRLREKSALLLQRRTRGLLARQRARGGFRADFISRIGQVRLVEQSLRGKVTPQQRYLAKAVALPLVRMGLFVNDWRDADLVSGVLLLVNRANLELLENNALYCVALSRLFLRAETVAEPGVIQDVLLSRFKEHSLVAKSASVRACSSTATTWNELATKVLNSAMLEGETGWRAVGEAFLLACEVDPRRAGELFRSVSLIDKLCLALLTLHESAGSRVGLFGNDPKPRPFPSPSKVFPALAMLSTNVQTDQQAALFVQACQRYFYAQVPLAVCLDFRALVGFPSCWRFLNQLHELFVSVDKQSLALLCHDQRVLGNMWTTSLELDMAYACKSTLHFIDLVDDVELFRLGFLPTAIGKLKQFLLEQSLQGVGVQSTTASVLFRALFERWSRREEDGEAQASDSGSSKLWLFPPQANLTSPRSRELLRLVPMVFPFEQRAKHFQDCLHQAQFSDFDFEMDPALFVQAKLHRGHLLDEAFTQLRHFDFATSRQRLKVTFISPLGLEEAGIGQGIFKEFLTQVCAEAFANPELFSQTPRGTFFPTAVAQRHLAQYEFLGRVMGKAVCDGVLIESQLSPFVINLMLGRRNLVHDLQFLDSSFYVQLLSLKRQPAQALMDMGLTFSTWSEGTGREVELVANGSAMPVTLDNVHLYIALLCDFKLNLEYAAPIHALSSGFSSALTGANVDLVDLCHMFTSKEFAMVIGGSKQFAVTDLRANVQYAGGYHASQPYIQEFWDVVSNQLSQVQQSKLLRFITSCSRPPLAGFAAMEPKVTIYQVRDDEDRLPTSSTCVNLLKLPKYASKEILAQKLLMAIESDSGFELS